jgi:large subunit ribosomal protein L3
MSVTGILGKKIGMTQLFDDRGEVHPITVLQAGPCVVTQLKTLAGDGYVAAQIGLIEFVKGGKVNKPMAGHFAKNNVPPVKLMREVPLEAAAEGENGLKAGDKVLVDIFEEAKYVDVIGTSKGRGFAGVVRRHHFGGGPKARLVLRRFRRVYFPGSVCRGTWEPSRSRCAIYAFAVLIWTKTSSWSKAQSPALAMATS